MQVNREHGGTPAEEGVNYVKQTPLPVFLSVLFPSQLDLDQEPGPVRVNVRRHKRAKHADPALRCPSEAG